MTRRGGEDNGLSISSIYTVTFIDVISYHVFIAFLFANFVLFVSCIRQSLCVKLNNCNLTFSFYSTFRFY